MNTKLEELLESAEFQKIYAVEDLAFQASELISNLLLARSIKKADLARLLGKTPAYVTQLLSGKTNMTLQTLAEVVHALGARVEIKSCETTAQEGATATKPLRFDHVISTKISVSYSKNPTFNKVPLKSDFRSRQKSALISEYVAA